MTEILTVLNGGVQTTIQDMGRRGLRHQGISPGGAADSVAARMANVIVGNLPDAPVIEVTLHGAQFEVMTDTVIAVCGGDLAPNVNGNPIVMWQEWEVRSGDLLHFMRRKNGCRAYIAIPGGVAAEKILGSASTDIRCGFGKVLKSGDVISSGMAFGEKKFYEDVSWVYEDAFLFRVIPGPNVDRFSAEAIAQLCNSEFTVTTRLDRSGIRLSCPPILAQGGEMLSEPVHAGNIQVVPDGSCIILGPECQTVGGYPRIASIISADLHKIGQLYPGDKIRFRAIGETEAVLLLKKMAERGGFEPPSHL